MMADMPVVKPRNMAAKLTAVAETHAQIRDNIANAAQERQAYYAAQNQALNAQARLEGKAAT